jgi:hypothetical protein
MTSNQLTPDLSEARRLLHYGMHLVPLHKFEKRPFGDDWNAPHKRVKVIDDSATGYGLPLAANKLCSVDPDNWPLAVRGMRAIGFDLQAIMAAGARTSSTRPGSGGRSAFAEEPDLSWLSFRSPGAGTVIEFRAFSSNLQDCVPGVVYADKGGTLRTQAYANDKRLDDAPGLPDDLMVWWQRCSTDITFLREQERMFFAALDVAPGLSISTGRGSCVLAYPAPGCRGPYNSVHSVESILEHHEYAWDGKSGRWAPPTATGAPSVRPIPGKDGLWQSDHASDPLKGTFDAWTAHVVLDHHGDVEVAIEEEGARKTAIPRSAPLPVGMPTGEWHLDPVTGEMIPPQPESDHPQMRLVSVADVLSNPQPPHEFVWGPYLPCEALTLESGHGGTGKSGFNLQLAAHVAMGLPFLGFPVIKTKSLFFSAEDSSSVLRHRLGDICRNHGIDPVDLAERLHVMDATDAAVLWSSDGPRKPGEATDHYRTLEKYINDNEIGFLVVDNASDTFGADRFDKSQVTQFVRALVRLVRARRGAVKLLTHVNRTTAASAGGRQSSGAGESYSDSVAWHNAARSRLFLAGDDEGGTLTLKHEKSNYGPKGDTLTLRRMNGCGLELAHEMAQGDPARAMLDEMALTPILTMMEEFYQRGESISTAINARNNAFKLLGNERAFPKGLKATDLWPLLRNAERQGRIHREHYRQDRKDRERWKVGAASSAPCAPTAPTESLQEVSTQGADSAPTAPTGVGGMGESAPPIQSAQEGAGQMQEVLSNVST